MLLSLEKVHSTFSGCCRFGLQRELLKDVPGFHAFLRFRRLFKKEESPQSDKFRGHFSYDILPRLRPAAFIFQRNG